MLNPTEKTDVMQRLKKIEGQIRGIRKMVEKETCCVDVLTQLASVRSTVTGVSKKIMKSHANTCVIHAVQQKRNEMIDEMMDVIFRFSK